MVARVKTIRSLDKRSYCGDEDGGKGTNRGTPMTVTPETTKSADAERGVSGRLSGAFGADTSQRAGTRDGDKMIDGNEGGALSAKRASSERRGIDAITGTFGPGESRRGTKPPEIEDKGGTAPAARGSSHK